LLLQSSRRSWSFHLFLGPPKPRFPRGWYWKVIDSLDKRLLSILSRWSNELFWYNFMSSIRFSTFSLSLLSEFLWRFNLVRCNNGLTNLISEASSFATTLLFTIQFLLRQHKATLKIMLFIRNFVSVVIRFAELDHIWWRARGMLLLVLNSLTFFCKFLSLMPKHSLRHFILKLQQTVLLLQGEMQNLIFT
jgi:hypothetical protein